MIFHINYDYGDFYSVLPQNLEEFMKHDRFNRSSTEPKNQAGELVELFDRVNDSQLQRVLYIFILALKLMLTHLK